MSRFELIASESDQLLCYMARSKLMNAANATKLISNKKPNNLKRTNLTACDVKQFWAEYPSFFQRILELPHGERYKTNS